LALPSPGPIGREAGHSRTQTKVRMFDSHMIFLKLLFKEIKEQSGGQFFKLLA
jgi:hypothetical protein